ncbi:MAG: hypothetical protein GX369_02255 [Euryarchaeota archaeon]|nr:hypothetical protein [Euryarchaeota archaeon]
MVRVRCPVCNLPLEGEDGDALSSTLIDHLDRDHDIEVPDIHMLRGGREGKPSTEVEVGEEGAVRGAIAVYGSGVTLRGEDLYGVDRPPRMDRLKEINFVDCPFCGFRILGDEEDALTEALKDHLVSVGEMSALEQFI